MGESLVPEKLTLELTNRCNLSCTFCCHRQMQRSFADFSLPLFSSLLRDKNLVGVKEVIFSGVGEPLLSGKESFFLDLLKKSPFCHLAKVTLETNGHFLTRQRGRALIEGGLDNLILTLTTNSPEGYLGAMGSNSLPKVKENILTFLDLRRDLKKETPKVFIRFLGSIETLGDLRDLMKFWNRKADKVLLEPRKNWAGQLNRERNPYLGEICPLLSSSLTVLSNGKVPLCQWDFEGKYLLGDANTQSISEIWKNPLRTFFLRNPQENLLCKWCLTSDTRTLLLTGMVPTATAEEELPPILRSYILNAERERKLEYLFLWKHLPPPPASILDVGCCETWITQILAMLQPDWKITGIDIREWKEFGKRAFTFLQTDLLDFNPPEKFDCSYAISTLEHFGLDWYENKRLYPDGWLRGLRKLVEVTKAGGKVLVTLPTGIQKGGFYFLNYFTPKDLEILRKEFDPTILEFYKQTPETWVPCSSGEAFQIEGELEGYPHVIVCFLIIKKEEKA